MLEATLVQTNSHYIAVKVHEDQIVHNFTIIDNKVQYIVMRLHGEPVARSSAEVVDIKEDEYRITSLTIKTELYDFEVVKGDSHRYYAYRSKIK